MAQCSRCYGSGYDGSCYICHGSGRDRSSDGTYETTCSSCSGSGKLRCSACGGSGQVADSSSSSSSSSSYGSSPSSSGGGGGGIDPYERRRRIIEDAVYKAQAGNVDEAINIYTNLIEDKKFQDEIKYYGGSAKTQLLLAYYNRGVGYLRKNDLDSAIADFLKARGGNENADLALCDSYFKKGDYDKSLECGEKAAYHSKSVSIFAQIMNLRGLCIGNKGNNELAKVILEAAADSGDKSALNNLKNGGVNYTPQNFNSDNQLYFSAGEKLSNAGDDIGSIIALDMINLPKEQKDAKTATTLGQSYYDLAQLYFKDGARDRGIQCIKYSANYNNKEAKKYLRENRIKHKRLLWEPYRNGFVSFILGLICGAGVLFGFVWYLLLKAGGELNLGLEGLLIPVPAIIALIVAFSLWRRKKNILFILMLLLAVPGWLSFAGVVPNSLNSIFSKAFAEEARIKSLIDTTVSVTNNVNLYERYTTESKVIKNIKKGDSVLIKYIPGEAFTDMSKEEEVWIQVEHNNSTGYIRMEFLDFLNDGGE